MGYYAAKMIIRCITAYLEKSMSQNNKKKLTRIEVHSSV